MSVLSVLPTASRRAYLKGLETTAANHEAEAARLRAVAATLRRIEFTPVQSEPEPDAWTQYLNGEGPDCGSYP